jgi:hypothetical protein
LCPEARPGEKLAREPGQDDKTPWVVAIETRGEGQYVLAPGCPPGCHPAGKTYDLEGEVEIGQVPSLTGESVELLLGCARALNRFVEAKQVVSGEKLEPGPNGALTPGSRPGDDYSRRGSWPDLLGRHGWELARERDGESWWRKPRKHGQGISATLGHCRTKDGLPLLYVFSTSAPPFEGGKAYSLFAARALFEHGGDFQAACKALAAAGYGETAPDSLVAEVVSGIEKIVCGRHIVGEGARLSPSKKLEALLKSDRKFAKAWRLQREDLSGSQDEYDQTLAYTATRVGWSTEETLCLIDDHRREHGSSGLDAQHADRLARVLNWCKDPNVKTDKELQQKAEAVVVGALGRDEILAKIRQLTGIADFAGLLQIGREDEQYSIVHEDGRETLIGDVNSIRTQKQFAAQVIKLLDIVVPQTTQVHWDSLIRLMLKVKRQVDSPDEVDAFREILRQYLGSQVILRSDAENNSVEEALKFRLPVILGSGSESELAVPFAGLFEWVGRSVRDTRWSAKRCRKCLRNMGFSPRQIVADARWKRWYYVVRTDCQTFPEAVRDT